MTKAAKPKADPLSDALERSIRAILSNPKATAKAKSDAIANGIKLVQIRHRISPESQEDFFGESDSK
jgi:hypothetical protein